MNKWVKIIVVSLCCAVVSSCCWMPIEVRWKGWGCHKQDGVEQKQPSTAEGPVVATAAPDATTQPAGSEVAKTGVTTPEPKNSAKDGKPKAKTGGSVTPKAGGTAKSKTRGSDAKKAERTPKSTTKGSGATKAGSTGKSKTGGPSKKKTGNQQNEVNTEQQKWREYMKSRSYNW